MLYDLQKRIDLAPMDLCHAAVCIVYRAIKQGWERAQWEQQSSQELQKQISDFARNHSRNTAQIELTVIKMVFDFAVVAGNTAASPADKVRLPKHMVAPNRRGSLTDEQERALVALEDHLKSANGLWDIPRFPSLATRISKNRIGLLFPGKDGGFMRASETHSLWKAYCREAGLNEIQQTDSVEIVEIFPITPHCL
ncbi:hypothetical protein OBV_27140 [Oscillibacter valericigenes Sjm18-20]|nr:hypothetical protein OBV_27140 [Oscillibacter valericigenes Sjm18-20]